MTRLTLRPSLMLASLLVTFGTGAVSAADGTDTAMRGFTAAGATQQSSLEQRFDALLDPADQRDWMKQMSAEPNHVGSPHDKANAELMLAKFKDWGWDAHIETFNVLYPTPNSVSLELLGAAGVHREAAASRRSPAMPRRRAKARCRLCRLRRRWRCHRRAGLRQLRHARRLQGARAPGHRREGQDRHRPLRRRLARTEAEAGAGARRGRLPDLFRSARRRLCASATSIRRAAAARPMASSAARWRTCSSIRAIR